MHAHMRTCMHTSMCAHTCAFTGAYRHVAGVRSVAMLAQEAQGRRSLRSQVQNRRSLRSKVQGYAAMGTNWHDINVWMDPAISRVVGRALAHPSASMIEHGVGYATVYELCRTRRWHGHAGQFAEPIRMLPDAAVDMGELVDAAREHLRALAPQGALPESIRDVMEKAQEAWDYVDEWHDFLCAVRLAVVWSQGDPAPLYLLTGGQAPWVYTKDLYEDPDVDCLLPVGPGVNRPQAECLYLWIYDLWAADDFET